MEFGLFIQGYTAVSSSGPYDTDTRLPLSPHSDNRGANRDTGEQIDEGLGG